MAETGKKLRDAQIIGISGKQFAGKDELTRLLLQRLPEFRQIPIALAIKQAYALQNDLTLAQIEADKPRYRPDLIALGNWGRAQDPDYWLKQVLNQPGRRIISDVRLVREAELLRQQGAFLIRVNADRAVRAQRGQLVSEDDPTECALDDFRDWDWIVTNNHSVAELAVQLDLRLKAESV
jgi:phosphomevalonate kinase